MRRQTQPHGLAARWAMRPLDLDPCGLPVRYSLPVANGADHGREAWDRIEIRPGIVAIEHEVSGLPSVRRAFAWEEFAGVAIRIQCLDEQAERFAVSVNLHHADPKLCFPLFAALDMEQAGERWHAWGRLLKLPLLLPTADGGWREPVERFGKLIVNPPYQRPARLSLARRRSCFSAIREPGDLRLVAPIPGEELIARS